MPCALCTASTFEQIATSDAKSGDRLYVGLCTRCGLVQQHPLPTREQLTAFYSTSYRAEYKGTFAPKAKHVYRAGQTALQRLDFLAQNGITQGRLLDVGAGGGEFVYLAGKLGFDATGIEPNEGYAGFAASNYAGRVRCGTLDMVEAGAQFDVITMFHVLEHLHSPLDAFALLATHLAPGGKLFVEVPWIDAADASPTNIYFMAHLYYFSEATLVACASRQFEPIRVDTQANLKILFQRKGAEGPLALPSDESVRHIRERLAQKGWFEYITKGRALMKVPDKIGRYFEERTAANAQPRDILDGLVAGRERVVG